MKGKASWLAVAIILVALFSIGLTLREQQALKRWEYKVVVFSFDDRGGAFGSRGAAEEMFTRHGAEGWELVSQSQQLPPSNPNSATVLFYFKRPR